MYPAKPAVYIFNPHPMQFLEALVNKVLSFNKTDSSMHLHQQIAAAVSSTFGYGLSVTSNTTMPWQELHEVASNAARVAAAMNAELQILARSLQNDPLADGMSVHERDAALDTIRALRAAFKRAWANYDAISMMAQLVARAPMTEALRAKIKSEIFAQLARASTAARTLINGAPADIVNMNPSAVGAAVDVPELTHALHEGLNNAERATPLQVKSTGGATASAPLPTQRSASATALATPSSRADEKAQDLVRGQRAGPRRAQYLHHRAAAAAGNRARRQLVQRGGDTALRVVHEARCEPLQERQELPFLSRVHRLPARATRAAHG